MMKLRTIVIFLFLSSVIAFVRTQGNIWTLSRKVALLESNLNVEKVTRENELLGVALRLDDLELQIRNLTKAELGRDGTRDLKRGNDGTSVDLQRLSDDVQILKDGSDVLMKAFMKEKEYRTKSNESENKVSAGKDFQNELEEVKMELQTNLGKLREEMLAQISAKCSCDSSQPGKFAEHGVFGDYDTETTEKPTLRYKSCKELLQHGVSKSGVYTLYPTGEVTPIEVYCDQDTDGGGWIVFQSRKDGSVSFDREWTDYKTGFGDLNGEFWLGNENLHILTRAGDLQLRVDLRDWENNKAHAIYDQFRIGPENDNYSIHVENFNSGTAGDAITYHNGMPFSTKDRDNDNSRRFNCAEKYDGGWWFNSCLYCNLNGEYFKDWRPKSPAMGIYWYFWKRYTYSLKVTEMKFR